jgi:hypothetical protein
MRLTVTVAAAVTTVPLLITACSASSPTSPATATQQATASAQPSVTPSPAATPLTGAQLKAMLEPRSYFPPAFAPDPSGSVNTGDTYQPVSAPGKLPCSRLNSTGWIDLADVGAVSFAQSDFIAKSAVEEYAQEIDQFQGSDAKTVMAHLRRLRITCPSYTDTQTGSQVAVKLGKGVRIGNDSLSFTLSSPTWQGGTTLEAVRVGSVVVTVLYSANAGVGATQAKTLATLLARKVVTKLQGTS